MKKFRYIIFVVLFLCTGNLSGQKVFSYIINDFAEINPAGISMIDSYQINIKGFNSPMHDQFFSGGYLKLIAPIEKINSRVGFHTQFYNQNDFSDFKYGLSYSYTCNLSEQSFLAFGLKASIYHNKDKYYKYVINGMNYIETNFNSNKLNIDAGLWFQNNNLGIGLSYNHINSPEHKAGVEQNSWYPEIPNPYLYEPELNLMVNHKIKFIDNLSMVNSMVMYDLTNTNNFTEIVVNNILNLNNTFLFGSAWEILSNSEYRIRFFNVLGFNLQDRYKIFLSHSLYEYESNEYIFINTSKKFRPNFECSFLINI